MKTITTLFISLFALLALFLGISCIDMPVYTSPQGYDLNRPVKYYMTESLKEISGIAFHHGNSDTLYTEEDEDGKVYYFHLGDKQVNHSKFGKPGDYEDIAILGEQIILLRSDGVFFIFPFSQVRNKDIAGVQKWNDVLPQGEYEGLYADSKTSQLYALCKHCDVDNTAKTNSGYIFKLSPNGNVKQTGRFSINVRDIEALIGKKKIEFHPSAITKNPITNEWYILSSVNKILVVADAGWKVKAVYPLNASLFVQPEGIAFDNQNNLYISNEGDKITPGTVFKFNYKK
ncbi:MAG TPA: SdiA-regulated domain-containing protein [Mucilaginibacter sp.]